MRSSTTNSNHLSCLPSTLNPHKDGVKPACRSQREINRKTRIWRGKGDGYRIVGAGREWRYRDYRIRRIDNRKLRNWIPYPSE